jgi:O-succinylbenzoate synthase
MTLQEAVSFARSLPARSVSFIEEPLRDPAGIGEFHAATSIPSALDESLWQQPALLKELPPESVGALVLKPNRLGGIQRSLELSRIALQRNIPAILSSAFESGISLGLYAWLAALIAPTPAACGLDTCRYLESDLLQHPFTAENGVIDPETAWMNSREVNLNLLNHLSSWTL